MDGFSERERLEQAIGNMVAMQVTAHDFLRERDIDPAELDRYFGERFAEGWAESRGDVAKIAHDVALNMTTLGFETSTTTSDGEATIHARWTEFHDDPDWPTPVRPALAASGVVFEPIMAWLGVGFSWDADDDGMTFRIKS